MKPKRYIVIPICLAIYFGSIACLYAKDWIVTGHSCRLWISIAVEILIIFAAAIFLKKRESST